ncbi:MAG: twin-arginine translocase TatA/TatE family subunit [Myxococcales bacterium]|nr:twin-arginine translocase TatA/TatE family subunit [Myxococcales bacterium]MDD9966204.1 twin-arginine translocase TatA/TatE family subunit [Myxococcales bacterium]
MSELLVVFAILVLLFGAKRLPQLADGMGKAIRNFKKGLHTDDEEDVTPVDKQVEETSSAKPEITAELGAQQSGPQQTAEAGQTAEQKS